MVGIAAILVAVAILVSCTATGGGSFCSAAKPIRPEASDVATASNSLVAQVVAHNETGAALCGWKPD